LIFRDAGDTCISAVGGDALSWGVNSAGFSYEGTIAAVLDRDLVFTANSYTIGNVL
jgi:hypothetical protein